ncbi:F-box/LRR-repeat protein 8-like [Hemicordylus capensis]|uniref:F-box/LRR-repeat protein 8-like n=1 Tax=Hemicordylus capensis TaxID=884348 RepID=UPI0023036BBC|nr:F-box/LRR-repeat protein 8-like [Hemicordylus capensis]XP_053126431.1 F-box/LRR-repeat protein 8-like [Hemicordylus capensis]XP_053126432.1 F-box/LRR-repeat protein 8-like [Hemicordylus capensis]
MSTPTKDFWNDVPEEILAHIFSYLPFKDRHMAFDVCQRWFKAVSVPSVWSFTEIRCNTENMSEDDMLRRLQQFLCSIKHLKIVLDPSQQLDRCQVTQIFDRLSCQSHKVRGLSIECGGSGPYFFSGQDILESFRTLCENTSELDLQYIDFRQMPFTLDNRLIRLIASSSPNLHTLLINNHPTGIIILEPETVIEVLRVCPKLSALGVYNGLLCENLFRELVTPSRGPLRFLDVFCEGLHNYIHEELWSSLTERHPQVRVGLEFGPTFPSWNIPLILMPNIPVIALQFSSSTNILRLIWFVTASYGRTLEKLVLRPTPSEDLNLSLIELAERCVHLKEIHCSCAVSQAVIDAFLLNCPGLIRYTLSKHPPF